MSEKPLRTVEDEARVALSREIADAAKKGKRRRMNRLMEEAKTADPMAELVKRTYFGAMKHGT